MEALPASSLPPPVTPPPAPASATPASAQQPTVPSQAQVASVVAATHVGAKRRRVGQHVVHPQPAPAAASVVPPAASIVPPAFSLAPPQPPATKGRKKKPSLGLKGAAATKVVAGGAKVKRTTSRKKPAPALAPAAAPPLVVHEVLDGMSAPPTSFMGLLEDAEKKEVKLAQVEARREEAKRKADLEERMIKVKEAKAWKELMVEEKEHMMMSKKDMDEDQLMWWKEYKEDIAERKRIFHG
ncbi:hypothetical protein ZWY2020_055988 [Hordeum vulgare]|nr:hypothetical protein ZWY2020_055988 [Hordeum vulgare]